MCVLSGNQQVALGPGMHSYCVFCIGLCVGYL